MNHELYLVFEKDTAFDYEQMLASLHRLRKVLDKTLCTPTPTQVHLIRSEARKVGCLLGAMGIGKEDGEVWTLDSLHRISDRAGEVRDLDVLGSMADELKLGNMKNSEKECLDRLKAHLSTERHLRARRLRRQIERDGSDARRQLKAVTNLIEAAAENKGLHQLDHWTASLRASARRLKRELARWQPLTAGCLHAYRTKIRELHLLLRAGGEADGDFAVTLGQVKDAIGEWHDWVLLSQTASQISKHADCGLLRLIVSLERQHLDRAVAESARMRRQFLTSISRIPLLSPQFAA